MRHASPLLLIRLSLLTVLASAVSSLSSSQQLHFQSYKVKDGLPSNGISALFQDSRGYLWIGTNNGISVYDGTEFRNFSIMDGLPNLVITSIAESQNNPGSLWIGTIAGGIVKLSAGKVQGKQIMLDNPSEMIEDREGALWVAAGRGIYVVRGDSSILIQSVESGNASIQSLRDSIIVALADNRIIYFHVNGKIPPESHNLGLKKGTITSPLSIDVDGTAWFLTSSGIYQHTMDSRTTIHQLAESVLLSKDIPSGLCDDGDGTLWFTTPRGLLRFNKRTHDHGFSEISRHSGALYGPILRDREGNLWMGADGLLKLSERKLYHIPLNPVNQGRYTMSACTDSNGHIWIVTSKELLEVYRSNTLQWKSFSHPGTDPHSLSAQGGLYLDPFGRLWKGPDLKGVYTCYAIQANNHGPSVLREIMSIAPQAMIGKRPGLVFVVDRNEHGWFSMGSAGLIQVDLRRKQVLMSFVREKGLPSEPLRALLVDRGSNIWAGSWATGLSVKSPASEEFANQDFKDLTGKGVRSLHEDRDGTIWIGTRYGGLVRFRNGEFKSISVNDGLQSNSIWSLAEAEKRIFCGTDVGLESVSKTSGAALLPKEELIGKPVISSGAYRDEFVWSVSTDELLILEEPDGPSVAVPPLVYIRGFVVNGIALETERIHILDSDRNTCSFEFVGLSYRDEKAIRYQYRMIGVDSSWSTPTKQRSITFAALSPGEYRFEVMALNAENIASTAPASLSFEVTPPFWQRWWFVLISVVVFCAVLYTIYWYRVSQLLEVERLRMRIASDLHDDVGTNLSSIMVASQIMERKFSISQIERDQLLQLRSTASKTQEMLKDIVWLLSPRNDSLDDLLLKFKEIAARLCPDKSVTFKVTGGESLNRLDLDFKRNLVLFYKEVLNNVAKHSEADDVRVTIGQEGSTLLLSIQDNGKGFDVTSHSIGNGLPNLRQRAAILGGTMQITSTPGAGCTIVLRANITHMRSSAKRFKSIS